MRNVVIYLFFGLGLWSCNKTKSTSFSIDGRIEGHIMDSTEISVSFLTLKNEILEEVLYTTYSKNNKFHLEGNINELSAADLFFDDVEIPVYLEPVAIKIVIDKNNPYAYKLSGTSVEKENIELRNILFDDMNTFYRIRNNAQNKVQEIFNEIELHSDNHNLADSLMQKAYYYKSELTVIAEKIDSIQLDFIKKHNTYQITPHLLYKLLRNDFISKDTIVAIYNDLLEQSKVTLLGRLALEQIKQKELLKNRKDISIGDLAPDFSRESMMGDTISLSNFIGKSYILLDFWASWCGPCIKGIPDIKNIHKKYNENLIIIGISLDSDREDWLKAVNEHQIGMWPHILSDSVLDNSYFIHENSIMRKYNIGPIPSYILIDKQGKIIAYWHNIGEEQLIEIDKILMNL